MLIRVQFDFTTEGNKTGITVIPVSPYGNQESGQNTYCPEAVNSQKDIDLFIKHIRNDSTDESICRTTIRVFGYS